LVARFAQSLALAAVAIFATAALAGCGCGAVGSAQGEWSRVDPETSVPLGDVLKVEGGSWSLTGNPAMSGKVEAKDGNVQLIIEKVGDQTRAEAIATPGALDTEAKLKELDEQLVFQVESADGKTVLRQVGKKGRFAEWRFEKREPAKG
jgi:hypothetical protein